MPWLPEVGNVSWDFIKADNAAQEYDERLRFRVNEANGQYAVFIRQPDGKPDYPVLGFGFEIPHPDKVQKDLYDHDTVRHGFALLDKLNAENDKIRSREDERFQEIVGDSAERIAHAFGQSGIIIPGRSYRKVGKKYVGH